jgi:hypothetical protein
MRLLIIIMFITIIMVLINSIVLFNIENKILEMKSVCDQDIYYK